MSVWVAPGGWRVELVTLTYVARTEGARDSHNDSAGDGEQFRVSQYGVHSGYARTVGELVGLLGDVFGTLIELVP